MVHAEIESNPEGAGGEMVGGVVVSVALCFVCLFVMAQKDHTLFSPGRRAPVSNTACTLVQSDSLVLQTMGGASVGLGGDALCGGKPCGGGDYCLAKLLNLANEMANQLWAEQVAFIETDGRKGVDHQLFKLPSGHICFRGKAQWRLLLQPLEEAWKGAGSTTRDGCARAGVTNLWRKCASHPVF